MLQTDTNTVSSAFTVARFLNSESISGNPLGLRIAAGNAPNLVDPTSGTWGKVVLDPINITQNTTFAKLNTLGSLIATYITTADDGWRERFLKAATPPGGATPKSTLEAMTDIARTSWAHPKDLYALFDEAYPQPPDGSRRKAPFWMPGSQSGVLTNIGGGTVNFSPNGMALSAPVTGFTGMGVGGIGWGNGVSPNKIGVTSFNGTIGVMDFEGRPIGKENDFPFAGKVGGLQGVGVAANGDVWIADATKNQMLYFPGGRVKDGKLVQVKGLKSPFGVAIDAQNRVLVSNAQSDTVVRFPANDPSKAKSFCAGIGVRGIALDSKGNLWVASNMSLDFPPPQIPDGVSIMKQFQLAGEHMIKMLPPGKTTGVVNLIRPDGTQPAPMGYTGGKGDKAISAPWGVSIDGNDGVGSRISGGAASC